MEYRWFILFGLLLIFYIQIISKLNETNRHLENIWDNVAEIETTNEHVEKVDENLKNIYYYLEYYLNEIEQNTR